MDEMDDEICWFYKFDTAMHLLCDYAALLQYLGKTHSDARKLSPTRVAIFLKAEIEVRVFMGINLVWV